MKRAICEKIFRIAKEYLLSFDKINMEILNKYLYLYKTQKPSSINDLMKGMLNTIANKQGMPKTIGKIKKLKPFLFNFNPELIIKKGSIKKEIINRG